MTDEPDQELPPAKRRRLIIGAVLHGLVVTTVLVVLYYLLPLDRPLDTGTAVRLLIGLLVFVGLTVWQVRAIAGSRYPGLRAAEALGLIIPLYLLLFASTYFLMERALAANFTQPLTRTDALYSSGTVFTTVGFGDITAKSETAYGGHRRWGLSWKASLTTKLMTSSAMIPGATSAVGIDVLAGTGGWSRERCGLSNCYHDHRRSPFLG